MKKCSRCKEEKSYNLFYKNSRKKDGYQDICIDCKKQQDKEHWVRHKDRWNKHYNIAQKERHKYIKEEKQKEGCKKCGDTRSWVLDFHHLDPSTKEKVVGNSGSLTSLKKEIEKCIVLCSNCHREFHYFERNNNITIEEYIKFQF